MGIQYGLDYLTIITLYAWFHLCNPVFNFAIVTPEARIWGDMFTFGASLELAVVANLAFLGAHSILMCAPVSRLFHVHVVLFMMAYMFCLVAQVVLWDEEKVQMSTNIQTLIVAVANGTDGSVGAVGVGTITSGFSTDTLKMVAAAPFVLFNFLLLPVALCAQAGMVSIKMIESAA